MSLKTWADGLFSISIGDEADIFDALNNAPDDRVAEILVNEFLLTVSELTNLCRTNRRANDVICGSDQLWLLLLRRDFALAARPENMIGRSDGEKAILSRSMQRYVIANNQGGNAGVRDRARALYRALYEFVNADGALPVAASVDRDVRRGENERLGSDASRLLIELSSAPIVRGDRVNVSYRKCFLMLSLCDVPGVREFTVGGSVMLADFIELMFDANLFQPEWLWQRLVVSAVEANLTRRDPHVLDIEGGRMSPFVVNSANPGGVLLWPPFDASAAPSFQRTTAVTPRDLLFSLPTAKTPYLFVGRTEVFGFAPPLNNMLYGADEKTRVMAIGQHGVDYTSITSVVGDFAMVETIVDGDSEDESDAELLSAIVHLPTQTRLPFGTQAQIGNSRVHTSLLLDVDEDGHASYVIVLRNNLRRDLRVVFKFSQVANAGNAPQDDTDVHEMIFPDIENAAPDILVTETHLLLAFGIGTVVIERPSKDFSRPPKVVADRTDADRIAVAVNLRNRAFTRTCDNFRNRRTADDAAATSSTKRRRARQSFI